MASASAVQASPPSSVMAANAIEDGELLSDSSAGEDGEISELQSVLSGDDAYADAAPPQAPSSPPPTTAAPHTAAPAQPPRMPPHAPHGFFHFPYGLPPPPPPPPGAHHLHMYPPLPPSSVHMLHPFAPPLPPHPLQHQQSAQTARLAHFHSQVHGLAQSSGPSHSHAQAPLDASDHGLSETREGVQGEGHILPYSESESVQTQRAQRRRQSESLLQQGLRMLPSDARRLERVSGNRHGRQGTPRRPLDARPSVSNTLHVGGGSSFDVLVSQRDYDGEYEDDVQFPSKSVVGPREYSTVPSFRAPAEVTDVGRDEGYLEHVSLPSAFSEPPGEDESEGNVDTLPPPPPPPRPKRDLAAMKAAALRSFRTRAVVKNTDAKAALKRAQWSRPGLARSSTDTAVVFTYEDEDEEEDDDEEEMENGSENGDCLSRAGVEDAALESCLADNRNVEDSEKSVAGGRPDASSVEAGRTDPELIAGLPSTSCASQLYGEESFDAAGKEQSNCAGRVASFGELAGNQNGMTLTKIFNDRPTVDNAIVSPELINGEARSRISGSTQEAKRKLLADLRRKVKEKEEAQRIKELQSGVCSSIPSDRPTCKIGSADLSPEEPSVAPNAKPGHLENGAGSKQVTTSGLLDKSDVLTEKSIAKEARGSKLSAERDIQSQKEALAKRIAELELAKRRLTSSKRPTLPTKFETENKDSAEFGKASASQADKLSVSHRKHGSSQEAMAGAVAVQDDAARTEADVAVGRVASAGRVPSKPRKPKRMRFCSVAVDDIPSDTNDLNSIAASDGQVEKFGTGRENGNVSSASALVSPWNARELAGTERSDEEPRRAEKMALERTEKQLESATQKLKSLNDTRFLLTTAEVNHARSSVKLDVARENVKRCQNQLLVAIEEEKALAVETCRLAKILDQMRASWNHGLNTANRAPDVCSDEDVPSSSARSVVDEIVDETSRDEPRNGEAVKNGPRVDLRASADVTDIAGSRKRRCARAEKRGLNAKRPRSDRDASEVTQLRSMPAGSTVLETDPTCAQPEASERTESRKKKKFVSVLNPGPYTSNRHGQYVSPLTALRVYVERGAVSRIHEDPQPCPSPSEPTCDRQLSRLCPVTSEALCNCGAIV